VAEARSPSGSWPTSVAVIACVAIEGAIAASSFDGALRVTALLGMASVAVGVSFHHAMGFKRESPVLRAVLLVPLAFSIVVIAVLILDAHFRQALGTR
jgi:hypothetical protein